MSIKNMCKTIYALRPDIYINVHAIFGTGINDRALLYSTLYEENPPNFDSIMIEDRDVSFVEIIRDIDDTVECANICYYRHMKD